MHLVWSDLLITTLIYFVLASGLNLIIGYARALSVHHAALFAIGAFTYATMARHGWSRDLVVTAVVAAVIAGILSLLLAAGSLRTQGDYFIVASFAFQLVAVNLLFNWTAVSGGTFGVYNLPSPTVFGVTIGTAGAFIVVAGLLAVGTLGLVLWLGRGPFGRLARAMGQSESAVAAAGFSVLRVRGSVFVLAGMLAAAAGALYAGYIGIAFANSFDVQLSIMVAAMVVIGGAGSVVGSILGAALLTVVPALLSSANINQDVAGSLQQLIFAVMLVVVMIALPDGLAALPKTAARGLAGVLRQGRAHRSGPREGSGPAPADLSARPGVVGSGARHGD
jgi:ABC-type branched-subunit amino acid transport system permease subunit